MAVTEMSLLVASSMGWTVRRAAGAGSRPGDEGVGGAESLWQSAAAVEEAREESADCELGEERRGGGDRVIEWDRPVLVVAGGRRPWDGETDV